VSEADAHEASEAAGAEPRHDAAAAEPREDAAPAEPREDAAPAEPREDAARDWQRLSRRMLLVHPVQEIPRALPALIGVTVAGSSRGNGGLWALAGLAVTISLGLMRWFTTRYRITHDRVEVRQGLFRRRLLAVSRDRVRTVDVTSHALHRLLGLARVDVGTGRSDRERGGSVRLDGLTLATAAQLREDLLHRRPHAAAGSDAVGASGAAVAAPAAEPLPETEIVRLDSRWVRYGPFTLSGVVAIGVVAGFAANFINEAHVDPRQYGALRDVIDWVRDTPLTLAILVVLVAAIAVVAIASTTGYVLAFWGFRLTRNPRGTLHVTRGLITTRATTIEERRLHGVEVSEPLLLRGAGGARCIAIATGLRVGRGAERGGSLLLPPAPLAEARRVAATIVSTPEPVTGPLAAHGRRARRRRYTRTLFGWALLAGIAAGACALFDWPAWIWQAALALLPLALALAEDRYRSLGHAFAGRHLVARIGSLVRRRSIVAPDGIIGWNVEQSFFQRRAGLATLTATTAAGHQHYDVEDIALGEALRFAEEVRPGLLTPFLEPVSDAPALPAAPRA
jgi:putative membrane protein